MFLFGYELFTHIYNDSLMVQVLPPYYAEVINSCRMTYCVTMVTNLFIENCEVKALSRAPNPSHLWLRYVDDIFVVLKTSYKCEFLNHINAVEPNIKFTVKETRPDRSMPFLDTLVIPKQDDTLET